MTEPEAIPVLLVDDRPENLTLLEALLDNMGLALFKATSGNEALRLSLKHDFALVLMDVRMSDMDGYETAELMRANSKTSRLPIIFVTGAMQDREHQFKGYETGAFDYLLKPIELTVLRSKVRVFCELYQQRRMLELHKLQLETLVSERTAELNRTLDNLRESEQHFRELLASVTSYRYTVIMDGGRAVSTTHGPGCLAVTGFSAEEYAADPDLWYRMIHTEGRQAVLEAARKIQIANAADSFEHRIRHKDGSIRWVQTTFVPNVGPEGQFLSYDGVITDITVRKRAEEALLKSETKFRTLFENANDALFLLQGDAFIDAGKAIRSGETIYVQDIVTDPRMAPWRENALARGYHSVIGLPLKDESTNVFGILVIYAAEINAFTPDEIRLLEELSGDMAFGITVLRARIEHNRVEEALRTERGLFVGGPTVVFKWKAQEGWPVEYVSPNVADQFGYTPEDLTSGKVRYAAIVHPDDLTRVAAEVAAYSEQGVTSFEQIYRIAGADGEYCWIQDFSTVIRGRDGAVTHFLGYILDVTRRRKADEEIRTLNQELEQRVQERTAQLETANKELEAFSYQDGLTGIANRRLFDLRLEQEWRRCGRRGSPLSLIMVDIDYFKRYNDRYGHLQGDECLKQVAACIAGNARRAEDLAARYGGEEFVVLLPDADLEVAGAIAEVMRSGVEALNLHHPSTSAADHVSISLGVAGDVPKRRENPHDLISAADRALYSAKSAGRNRVCIEFLSSEESGRRRNPVPSEEKK